MSPAAVLRLLYWVQRTESLHAQTKQTFIQLPTSTELGKSLSLCDKKIRQQASTVAIVLASLPNYLNLR